jgi:spermidine synthase
VGGALEVIGGNRVVLIASDALKVLTSAASSADVVVSVLTAA